jgi:hypothetical protein
MDANLSLSLSSIKKAVFTFLNRFHILLFVFIVVGGAAIVVFRLNGIIISSSESNGYTSDAGNATFDQATIDRIEELKTRNQTNGQLDLSKGRTNPFVE